MANNALLLHRNASLLRKQQQRRSPVEKKERGTSLLLCLIIICLCVHQLLTFRRIILFHHGMTNDVRIDNSFIDDSFFQLKRRGRITSHLPRNDDDNKRQPIFLTAYIEPRMNYYKETEPGNVNDIKDDNEPLGDLITPLELRTHSPSDLRSVVYSSVSSCSDLPHNLPVDPGAAKDARGRVIMTNFNNKSPIYPERLRDVETYCPVDSDPFLPWMHDVFSSFDGSVVTVIAQNRRRCNTGGRFYPDVWNLQPQVALMQPVALKRVADDDIPARLWNGRGSAATAGARSGERYRLASHEDADPDATYTRFLCRFHSGYASPDGTYVFMGETLSRYPYNPEEVHSLKNKGGMLTKKGKDKNMFWLSQFQFDCPVPDNIRTMILSGTVDGRAYLDIVPIRTAPRIKRFFANSTAENNNFQADKVWGKGHVLPRAEASGRWANIPVCPRPAPTVSVSADPTSDDPVSPQQPHATKPHYLVGCLWTSAIYFVRTLRKEPRTDTHQRIIEWIEFHLMVGFDHIYVYDNSMAHSHMHDRDLSYLASVFDRSQVTVIPWPFRVCNNNPPANENSGERSSQYAAENSCRARYGDSTEWMVSFDTDEYMIPMGNHTSMKHVLREAAANNWSILSFRSSKSFLRKDHLIPYFDDDECQKPTNLTATTPTCLEKSPNVTFLSTYNCDRPRRQGAYIRAKKQIYRTAYVKLHFVHYSTVTDDTTLEKREKERYLKERFTDEENEAVMLHARTVEGYDTKNWWNVCKTSNKQDDCKIGIRYPPDATWSFGTPWLEGREYDRPCEGGYLCNCRVNERLDSYWLPMLDRAMERRRRGGDV